MADNTSYQVSARKWRPKTFQAMTGQEYTVRALANALTQQRLHHAYLFTGTRGVGKTTIARIFAKCLNCEAGVSAHPCGICNACQEIDAGRFIDLLEIDAASRTKVENTRELLDTIPYLPGKGRYKIVLIDEVHMLSTHSFNALLKTLEEPPAHVIFLLATTNPQKLPATVLSRCLQFHLKNIPALQIQTYLSQILDEEKITYEAEALQLLAHAANGSMRDALSLLDQAVAYGNEQVLAAEVCSLLGTFETIQLRAVLNALANKDAKLLLTTITQFAEQGADFFQLLEELLSLIHQIAIRQVLAEDTANFAENAVDQDMLAELTPLFTAEEIQLYYQIGIMGRRDLPFAPSARAGFEMILLRMLAFRPVDLDADGLMTSAATTTAAMPPAASITTAPAVAEKTVSAVNKSVSAAPDNTDWSQLVAKLNLTGATHALIKKCTLLKMAHEEILLQSDPKLALLLTDKQKAYITQAFTEYFQRSIKVSFITNSPGAAPTPTATPQPEQPLAQDKDEHVQAILQAFNAKIVEPTETT